VTSVARPRALLVDDDPLLLRVVGRMLRETCDVVLAASGAEALELLEAGESFDALVVDVNLPGVTDGVDVYRELRARARAAPRHARPTAAPAAARGTREPLFVFMTGDGRAMDALPRAPSVAFLKKPFERTQLLAALEPVLR
jgi:CheY-like chemotaxis protein